MSHRVGVHAKSDLADIWLYVAEESDSVDLADRVVDAITSRFTVLSTFPHAGRSRSEDFGAGLRSLAVGEYIIVYRVQKRCVLILRIVHGKRCLAGLFDH